ncbi:alpha/beta hydrolase [Thermoclostridium stercorarium subsp. leptospartum DSM 9219]|nr:alpha/beta fold hydrolase [Thermoclostridium stercorarium]AGI40040.1 lysophospholipase [Thermoclostridium stercorarium subsp. stercorarium DSM 8532]ANX01988.1 alpha/beta hydrolase [Thermoclostridium stercorarium subsp. leptospartum DSM 9219]
MKGIHMSDILCRPFSCRRGNLTIRGHVFRKNTGVLPTIIICHGFMANQRSVRHYAKLAASIGFAAFTFDFCGGCVIGKSDGRQSEMSVLTEVEDLKAVIGYIKTRDDTDSSRISLMGCSQGGVVCALTAAQIPDEIERLILFYPAFCIPDDARRGKMMFARFDPDNIPPVVSRFPMRLGAVYVKDVINMNIFEEITGYNGPVLLVHGTKDNIVDISYSRKAKEIYKNCEYLEIEGAGHSFNKMHDRVAMDALKKFLSGRV